MNPRIGFLMLALVGLASPALHAHSHALHAQRTNSSLPGAPRGAERVFRHALLISVDGLRSDALVLEKPGTLKAFDRIRRGAGTLNARTDPDWTITLPNHTDMFTGRFVEGADGHGWKRNVDPKPAEDLHANRKSYVAGCFDVAHDRGFFTGLWTGKTKFSLYSKSWDDSRGALDELAPDHGRDKIDVHDFSLDPTELVDHLIEALRTTDQRALFFYHFATTDLTGHLLGWDVRPGSPYMTAVELADIEVGRILDAIEADPKLKGQVAVLLTTDHGGGEPYKSHDQKLMAVDYTIPFFVWTGDDDQARDLYALNRTTRRDPGSKHIARDDAGLPPVRNGDAANVLLMLLALPPVPGSLIGAQQDLRVFPASIAPK